MWHLTSGTWHVTHDTWHLANMVSKFKVNNLEVMVFWRVGWKGSVTQWINESETKVFVEHPQLADASLQEDMAVSYIFRWCLKIMPDSYKCSDNSNWWLQVMGAVDGSIFIGTTFRFKMAAWKLWDVPQICKSWNEKKSPDSTNIQDFYKSDRGSQTETETVCEACARGKGSVLDMYAV